MRSRNAWLYSLGLSGVLAFGLTGCGGGDVPDPSADEAAATEEGGEAPIEPAAPAPAGEAPSPEVAAAPAAPAAPEAPAAPGAPAVASAESAPAPTAPQPDAPKSEAVPVGKSDTAEMLALATGAPPAPAGANAPSPATGSTPGGPAPRPGGAPGAPGERDDPSLAFNAGAQPAPGAGPGAAPGAGEIAPPRDLGAGPAPGGAEGMGGSDLAGGVGGNTPNEPGDTNSPHGAVKAFLYALEHKDRDRLAEATALRANSDEGGKYRELFSRIIDSSISDSELDDLSTKLQGFKDTGRSNQIKSTGREGVTIQKQLKDGTILQRTVTVRREKKGWGVLDISNQLEFDRPQMSKMPNRRR
ncbi:hypothetical protein [Paludisphaera rhizosphaerae]|uniref:hypothetical protein n=1 Tax=Paludisphaera rhizosphaerae TaxID=2711216 RepID=UPI0013EA10D5|nr:hypothetical protein [Paludisphaera rhizosphaerae]